MSFSTLPLRSIVRLMAKESNVQPVKVGSPSTLYESVSYLEEIFVMEGTRKCYYNQGTLLMTLSLKAITFVRTL